MNARERLGELLDARRADALDAAGAADLDRMLADPALAALALDTEEVQRLLEHALRGEPARAAFAASVVAAARAMPRDDTAARVIATVRGARRLRRRRARMAIAFASAAAVVAAIAVWRVTDERASIAGDGASIVRGGKEVAVVGDASVAAGDTVIAGDGAAILRWRDGTRLVLAGGGRLALLAGGGKRLELHAGRLDAAVAPQPTRSPLTVASPQATIAVIGTRFTLSVDAARSRLVVADGRVRFAGRDGVVTEVTRDGVAEASINSATVGRRIERVFAEDFEAAVLPPAWTAGTLVAPPVADGSARCALGGAQPYAPGVNTIRLERSDYAMWSEDLRLGFEVLVTAPIDHVRVMAWNESQQQNYGVELPPPEPWRWVHLETPVSAFHPYVREGERLRPGDRLATLYLMAGRIGEQRLYVDDVALWRER